MKKQLHKLTGRLKRGGQGGGKPSVPRITNDTLAEHREAVIAKGKRYKYPMQQTKHRTVIISTVIVLLLVIGTTFFTWWQLYRAQDTSQFFYRVTQLLPLPVGSVDGETVLYEDYLMELRSALHYLTTTESLNLSSDDGQRQVVYHKRQAMDGVLEQAYVRKLAAEENIRVSQQEIDEHIEEQKRQQNLLDNNAGFEQTIRTFYDWSLADYRHVLRNQFLKQKVVAEIDDEARQKAEDILRQARKDPKAFAALAEKYSEDEATKRSGGDIGFVSLDDRDPEGLGKAAAALDEGEVSSAFVTGAGGLYVIKTLEKREGEVRFARILVRFHEFDERFAALVEAGKVHEYIDIPEAATPVPQGQRP